MNALVYVNIHLGNFYSMEENAQKKQLEKGEKDKECAIGINVSLSNKYKGIFETTKQGRREETRVQCTKD